MSKLKNILFFLFIGNSLFAWTQTDSTLMKEVEVIKAYQPKISESFKISTSPKIQDSLIYTPTFNYSIDPVLLPVEKSIQHLPVVKLGNPPRTQQNTGYAKAGIGYEITPYAELFINTSPSTGNDFGVHLFHYSSFPSVQLNNELKTDAPFSKNMIKLFMKNRFKKAILNWELSYLRNGYRYYGFPGTDSLLYRSIEQTSDILNLKQAVNKAGALFNLSNQPMIDKFEYTVSLGYDYLWNMTGQTAHNGRYEGIYTLKKDRFNIRIGSKAEYFSQDSTLNYYTGETGHQFVHALIAPQIILERKSWSLNAGFNLGTIIDDDTSAIFHISPKINFTYSPIEGWLSLFAGSEGGLITNHYASVINENPFIDYRLEVKPTQEIIRLFGGINGKLSRKISYLFDVDYRILENLPFYYFSQYTYPAGNIDTRNVFNAKYDNINILRFGGNLRYSSQDVTIALSGNYFSYTVAGSTPVTHLPVYNAFMETHVRITSKWSAKIEASVTGERSAEIENYSLMLNNATGNWDEAFLGSTINQMETIIDINLGIDYTFSKNLGFFLSADNILNQNYEIWHGYNARGIMIMAGAKYTF